MNKKTAILIFANSAKEEAICKPFRKSQSLFEALNKQTIATVSSLQLPYFIVNEQQQIGDCFGQRFTNAIETVFNSGFENIITVGNDAPLLNKSHLDQTITHLEEKKLVLGPSYDGGFYLMGLNRAAFKKEKFINLPWQTQHLFSSIHKLLKTEGFTTTHLEQLNDIDNNLDIVKLLNQNKELKLNIRVQLLSLLKKSKITTVVSGQSNCREVTLQLFNKGSPIISLAA